MSPILLLFIIYYVSAGSVAVEQQLAPHQARLLITHADNHVQLTVNVLNSTTVDVYVLYDVCTDKISSNLPKELAPKTSLKDLPKAFTIDDVSIDYKDISKLMNCIDNNQVYSVGQVPITKDIIVSSMYSTRRYVIIHNPHDYSVPVRYIHVSTYNPMEYMKWVSQTLGSVGLLILLPLIGLISLCFCFPCFA